MKTFLNPKGLSMDMYQKVLSLILVFAALFCLGYGVTGFATLDFNAEYCDSNSDCTTGVCCYFYGDNAGICDLEENCDAISSVTMEAGSQLSLAPEVVQEQVKDEASRSYIAIILGLLILFLIIVVAYVEWKHEKHGLESRLGRVHKKVVEDKVVKKKVSKKKVSKKKVVKKRK